MTSLTQTERWSVAAFVATCMIACSSQPGGADSSAGAGGTGTNAGGASASTVASSSSTGGVVSAVAAGTGGSGGSPAFVCDPAPAPGSLYELSAKSYDINDIDAVSMCNYRGKVTLLVNTAAA